MDHLADNRELTVHRRERAFVVELARSGKLTLTVRHVIQEGPLVYLATDEGEDSLAAALALFKLSNIDITGLRSLSHLSVRHA